MDDAKRRSQPQSTPLSPFELLPNELWQQILKHLVNLDKKHLAEVSSRSRDAVNLPPFDTLVLRASDPTALKEAVTSCISMLKASRRFLRFRGLEIGVQVITWPRRPDGGEISLAPKRATILRHRDTEEVEHQSNLLDFQHVIHERPQKYYDKKKLERNSRSIVSHDDRWELLIELIRCMPDLEDLFFHWNESFPKCLLDSLHEHRPRCRLHLSSFEFRKLIRSPDGESLMIHEDELAVATSPCLHSIICDTKDCWNNTDIALLNMVSGMAPNLKEVTHLCWKSRDPLPHWSRHVGGEGRWIQGPVPFLERGLVTRKGRPPSFSRMFPQPWTGPLSTHDETSQRRGSLMKLALGLNSTWGQIGRQDLEIWASKTDLSTLKILHLHNDVLPSGQAWIEENRPFKSLEGLWVDFSMRLRERQRARLPKREDLSRFLQSFPPLKKLWVDFNRTPSFDDIAVLATVLSSLDELCFPQGAVTETKGLSGLPDETDLLVQALRSHGIKPQRLLGPRLVGRDVAGEGGEIYVLSNMEENIRLDMALEA